MNPLHFTLLLPTPACCWYALLFVFCLDVFSSERFRRMVVFEKHGYLRPNDSNPHPNCNVPSVCSSEVPSKDFASVPRALSVCSPSWLWRWSSAWLKLGCGITENSYKSILPKYDGNPTIFMSTPISMNSVSVTNSIRVRFVLHFVFYRSCGLLHFARHRPPMAARSGKYPTVNVSNIVGQVEGPLIVSYNARDLLVYAHGIGCSALANNILRRQDTNRIQQNGDELCFLYEGHADFCAFPTYPLVLPYKGASSDIVAFPGEP